MSVKRQATTELNHENWDKEDPEEEEEVGSFKTAPKEVLEKRVIITAKRRTQGTNDEAKKTVFSGFGGFNKTQPSSFDFLSKLTNGNKNTNNENSMKNDTSVSSSLFSSKPTVGSPGGIFGNSSTSPAKPAFGSSTSAGNLFSSTTVNTVATSSVFTTIKADSTVSDSPFKLQPATSTGETTASDSKLSKTNTTVTTTPQVTSNIFGVSSTSGTTTVPGKSLFASTNNNSSSLFKTQPTSSPAVSNTNTITNTNNSETKPDNKNSEKKITYYTKLKGLNESVSDWIKKHVEETPLCILTPIFKDYEKYLKEIQDEYESPANEKSKDLGDKNTSQSGALTSNKATPAINNVSSISLAPNTDTQNPKPNIFGTENNNTTPGEKPTTGFSFGIKPSSAAPTTTTISTGFTFGSNSTTNATATTGGFTFGNNISTNTTATTTTAGFTFGITSTSTSTSTTSSPFTFTPNKTANSNETAPFSFGIGKPFSFSSNVTQKVENTDGTNNGNNAQEDEDTPPKVEFTPIAEENSVFEKRCKVFHKKDGNFVDMGLGTLYIKKIDDSDKHQLLVRAHTSLGNVLLNVRLASAIPTQRMGKNNVMLVCIPTPTFKPPPIPVLIRVKTSEEADELLETLNKYKS